MALQAAVSYWMLCKTLDAKVSFLCTMEKIYLGGLVALEAYCIGLHPVVFGAKLPFLPLLLMSVYSALGVMYIWLCMASQWLPISAAQQMKHSKRA